MPKAFSTHGPKPVKAITHNPRGKAPSDRQRTRAMHTGSKAWRALRAGVLIRDSYTCAVCRRFGDQVDHKDGDSHNNDPQNLQVLCLKDHSAKTAAEVGRAFAILPKHIPSPTSRVTVVCGPPGAGKTTWANEHAQGDEVLDLDEIALNFGYGRDRPLSVVAKAIRMRNTRLADAVMSGRECVVIATCGQPSEREWWIKWGARLVELHPGVDVCIARVSQDGSRSESAKAAHVKAIMAWR